MTSRARWISLLGLLVALGAGAPSSALTLSVGVDGGGTQTFTDANPQLGCTTTGTAETCTGSGLVGGSTWTLGSWNISTNLDPVVNATIALTNTSTVTQTFTVTTTLPITAIPGATLVGGSVQGGATDLNNNGVTLSTATGSAFYTALIDSGVVQLLYPDPASFSAAAFGSVSVPSVTFGAPIPSQLGPAALTDIGIQLKFKLTPGDTASFTGVFVVEPVPEPGTLALAGLGLSGLALLGARRRKAA